MTGSRKENTELLGRPKAAVEIMVLNPDPAVHHNNKSVHENLWIKERFGSDNYLSIGVMLKPNTSELQFYLFEDCDKSPHPEFYSSLEELQDHLPAEKKDIFDRTHKVYLMGHGDNESKYGFGNYHAHDDFSHPPDDSEQIYGDNFDKLIMDILKNISARENETRITLEECHADNLITAKKEGYTKSFLERLSAKYPHVTFSGTGPWSDSNDLQESLETGSRASGGYPNLTAPITSMGGGIWKQGNTVIFHHNGNQIAVRKSPFASTETSKDLKINTVNYAREMLNVKNEKIIERICTNRKILNIEDLKHEPDFAKHAISANEETNHFTENEKKILKQEQANYLNRVQAILSKDTYNDRDVLIIALGLNHPFIFNGQKKMLDAVLKNENLLELVMVSCGKVLIAGNNNNNVIDLLIKKGVPIDSTDEKGMTALHYAVQNFYHYRGEQRNLLNKLLELGANPESKDHHGQSPLMLADMHSKKKIVIGGESVLELLQHRSTNKHSAYPGITESKFKSSQAIILGSLGHQPDEKRILAEKKSSLDDSSTKTAMERQNQHTAPASSVRNAADDSSITYSGHRKRSDKQY